MSVLLLNHDERAAAPLAVALESAGFSLAVDASAMDASPFEAVVLGQGASAAPTSEPSVEWCQRFRSEGYVGAIVAVCAGVAEGEAMLDAGADDFVVAPYEARELVARLRASIRRVSARAVVRWGPVELDRLRRVARVRDRTVQLTARESDLLAALVEAAGQVVPRARLRAQVWQHREDRGTNLVEVHLSRLRDKLGGDAAIIETVRRAGYRLRA